MTRPRREQVCLGDTPYYHIVSRCVRRTHLCGVDRSTGKSYEHRRAWIENRIRLLASLFGVDIYAYAVMSNHLHIVIKLCPQTIDELSQEDIARRWTCLYKGPTLIRQWLDGQILSPQQLKTVGDIVDNLRRKLKDLGWFMKCLNEPIARQANKEDGCTGHFWESRYKSQALLSEEALLSCMAYVDLNPIRAGIAKTPEEAEHTSLKERIKPQFNLEKAIQEQIEIECLVKFDQPLKPLSLFEEPALKRNKQSILFTLSDYLQLVDATGRCLLSDKRGHIPDHLPPIVERLGISCKNWLDNTAQFEKEYLTKFSKRHLSVA